MKNHFMKIKFLITPEWLLEWFWSLVKLHAFQWPHKLIACQTDSSNTKSGKLQKLGGGQKIFIFRGVALLGGGGGNFLGRGWYPSAHYCNYYIQSPALFKNILKFCTLLPKFSNIFFFFNILCSFSDKLQLLPFTLQNRPLVYRA